MAWRKIDDNKLTAIANSIRSQLRITTSMTDEEMPGLIDSIGIGVIPDYWKSYLATKATEINTAMSAAGENKSAFLWYTDAHFSQNYGQSPVILKYLAKNTGMQKTFFGGDIAVANSGELDILTAWQERVRDIPNHHSVIGNHDNQVTELPTAAERADFFILPERTGDMVLGTDATNGKLYYYIDNHIENTRYICMSTGRMWTYKDEMVWCADVLLSTPKNWHIVIISHLWLNNDYTNGGIITAPENYIQSLLDMFDAYNCRKSGTTSVNSVAYDFTTAGAKIEFLIGGHVHADYDFTTATGIPVILTECDAWQERDDVSSATQGTTTENCVYAIVADYGAKAVKVINVGRGDTRSIAIPDVVTYKNWVKTAYADSTMTTIYNNGKGYKDSTRLNSSGTETTESGWYVTGFIPAKPGDVVRLKNCYFPKTYTGGTNRSAVHPYNASGAYTGNYSSASGLPDLNPVYDTDGINILQFTVPSWYGSTFIRLTVRTLSENSIITVNEEISDVATYTNQLSKSLTLDGSAIFGDDYNGDGTPDGYKRDTRTSSSGDTSATGWCVTGLIPAKPGDIIRFKNMEYYDISGDGGSTPRTTFFAYGPSFNKITNASHNPSSPPDSKFNAVFEDNGDVIQLTVPNWDSSTAYIRICCGDLNENSIITVNEEID